MESGPVPAILAAQSPEGFWVKPGRESWQAFPKTSLQARKSLSKNSAQKFGQVRSLPPSRRSTWRWVTGKFPAPRPSGLLIIVAAVLGVTVAIGYFYFIDCLK